MPRTKAPSKKAKKSAAPKAKRNTVPAAVLAEVNDVKQQWDGRREAIIAKNNDLRAAITRTFNMTIMKLGAMADLRICWDSEDEDDDEDNVENVPLIASPPLDSTVSTSVVSPDFVSVTSSFVTHSEESVSSTRRSRSRVLTAKTPAQRSISVANSTTGYKTAPRTLRSSSHGRDRLAEMLVPQTRDCMPPPSTVRNRFCTPATHLVADGSRYNAITPKVVPNSSMSVLRRPRGGEMAFAMSGSPLMVASSVTDEICNLNVPLGDGTVISVLPVGTRPRDVPHFNDDTMEQLVQLRDNLDAIINSRDVQ